MFEQLQEPKYIDQKVGRVRCSLMRGACICLTTLHVLAHFLSLDLQFHGVDCKRWRSLLLCSWISLLSTPFPTMLDQRKRESLALRISSWIRSTALKFARQSILGNNPPSPWRAQHSLLGGNFSLRQVRIRSSRGTGEWRCDGTRGWIVHYMHVKPAQGFCCHCHWFHRRVREILLCWFLCWGSCQLWAMRSPAVLNLSKQQRKYQWRLKPHKTQYGPSKSSHLCSHHGCAHLIIASHPALFLQKSISSAASSCLPLMDRQKHCFQLHPRRPARLV